MMKKKLICLPIFMLFAVFFACTSDMLENSNDEEKLRIVGTETYISQVGEIVTKDIETRTLTYESDSVVPVLLEKSKYYLRINNIDYKEFFEDDNDPRIAVFAIAIAELEKEQYKKTETRSTLGGCALQALGVKELLTTKGVTKVAIKAVGKAVVKKAIPYAGWGIFAVEMGLCLYDD